jgi:hypothetical protein
LQLLSSNFKRVQSAKVTNFPALSKEPYLLSGFYRTGLPPGLLKYHLLTSKLFLYSLQIWAPKFFPAHTAFGPAMDFLESKDETPT